MKSREVGVITVIGLVLAAVGIVAPIVWDHYKSRTALEIRLISRSRLVGGGPAIDKLQFSYAGRPVAALSKLGFVLSNSGRTPIRSNDTIAPPTVTLPDAEILDVHVDSARPLNLLSNPTVDASHHSVSLAFPLLNPNDQIQFSLLVEADRPRVETSARIAGLTTLDYEDESGAAASPRRTIPATVWVVGAFTAFCLLVMLVGFHGMGEESTIKKLVTSDLVLFPAGLKPGDYKTLLTRAFPEHKKSDMKSIEDHLAALPPEEVVNEDGINKLRLLLRQTFPSNAMFAMMAFFAVLSTIGITYIVKTLW